KPDRMGLFTATNCGFASSRLKLVAGNAAHRAMLANEPLDFGRVDLGEQHGMHRCDLGWRPPTGPQATLPSGALEALGDRPASHLLPAAPYVQIRSRRYFDIWLGFCCDGTARSRIAPASQNTPLRPEGEGRPENVFFNSIGRFGPNLWISD